MTLISRAKRRFRRTSTTLMLSVVFLLVLLIAALVIGIERYHGTHTKSKTDQESLIVRSITSADHTIGSNRNAPIQLVVYADLSCPYCKTFFVTTLPKLQQAYGDQIFVAYRHLPLPSHPNSLQEADAAECVYQIAGNDAFWNFVRAVFSQSDYDKGIGLSRLSSIAASVDIPEKAFTTCMVSGASDVSVKRDALEASIAGITVTPSVVFKSATRALIVQGNYPSQFNAAMQYLLTENATP